ncbi:MAG: AI-2E family transporter [Gemmatimonadales bacterium]
MAFFDSRHQRAAIVLVLLLVGIMVALSPYMTGLLSIPVLYVVLGPVHRWLARFRWLNRSLAAALVVVLTILGVLLPGFVVLSLIVGEAQNVAGTVMRGPILDRIAQLQLGPFDIGAEVVRLGQTLVAWLGGNALSLLGTVTRLSINILLALFGLYYLMLNADGVWATIRPYIPFSPGNTERLRVQFTAIAISTVIGTGLTALLQGLLVTLGFTFAGLSNAIFWGVVTIVFAVLPVVGGGMIWIPGILVLVSEGRVGSALFLGIWCLTGAAIIDYIFRPIVYNRFAQVHPMITLVGAIAGIAYFGLLGLLIGPLALSYFFAIVKMYREEYVPAGSESGFTAEHPIVLVDSEGAPAAPNP